MAALFSKLLNPVVSPIMGFEGGPGTGAAAGHYDHIKQARAFVFSTKTFKMASLTDRGLHHLSRSEMKEAVSEILAALLMTTEESPEIKAATASNIPHLAAKTTKLRANLRKSITEAEKVGDESDYEAESDEGDSPDAIDYSESDDSDPSNSEEEYETANRESEKTGQDPVDDNEYDMEDEVDDETKFHSELDTTDKDGPKPINSDAESSDSESPFDYHFDTGSDVGYGNRGYGSRRLHHLLGARGPRGGFGGSRMKMGSFAPRGGFGGSRMKMGSFAPRGGFGGSKMKFG